MRFIVDSDEPRRTCKGSGSLSSLNHNSGLNHFGQNCACGLKIEPMFPYSVNLIKFTCQQKVIELYTHFVKRYLVVLLSRYYVIIDKVFYFHKSFQFIVCCVLESIMPLLLLLLLLCNYY